MIPVVLYLPLPKLHCVLSKLGGLCLDWDLECCIKHTATKKSAKTAKTRSRHSSRFNVNPYDVLTHALTIWM